MNRPIASLAQGMEIAKAHINGEQSEAAKLQAHQAALDENVHTMVGKIETFADDVVDFNQRVLKISQRELGMLNQAEFDISVKCLNEEVREFVEAHNGGDMIGAIDGLVDLMYFATGVLYKMGLTADNIDDVQSAVHAANMEKKLGVNARRGDGSAADAVKPEGWVAPEERIAAILDARLRA